MWVSLSWHLLSRYLLWYQAKVLTHRQVSESHCLAQLYLSGDSIKLPKYPYYNEKG